MRHSVCVASASLCDGRRRHRQRDVRDEAMTHTSQDTESDRECAARAQVSQESQDIRWILIFVKFKSQTVIVQNAQLAPRGASAHEPDGDTHLTPRLPHAHSTGATHFTLTPRRGSSSPLHITRTLRRGLVRSLPPPSMGASAPSLVGHAPLLRGGDRLDIPVHG